MEGILKYTAVAGHTSMAEPSEGGWTWYEKWKEKHKDVTQSRLKLLLNMVAYLAKD